MAEDDDHNPTTANAAKGFKQAADRLISMNIPSIKVPESPQFSSGTLDAIRRQAEMARATQAAIEDIDWSETPAHRAADAAEETRELIAQMASLTKDMVDLTQQSLAASESARADAAEAQKFARRATIASIIIASASFVAAAAAVVVSL